MGAPGHYILCSRGHIIGIIEDDMHWDKKLFKELERLEDSKCKCGKMAKYSFVHYGDINDCLSSFKLNWNPKEERFIIPRKLTEKQKEELKTCTIARCKKCGYVGREDMLEDFKGYCEPCYVDIYGEESPEEYPPESFGE